jgi:hypothetical protein
MWTPVWKGQLSNLHREYFGKTFLCRKVAIENVIRLPKHLIRNLRREEDLEFFPLQM